MKKITILLMVLMILPFAAGIEVENVGIESGNYYPTLSVMSVKYDPYPVEMGSYFDIWFRVENNGDQDAANVVFKLTPKYPFSIDSTDVEERNLGTILARQQAVVKYKVRVDRSAVSGNNDLDYEIKWTGGRAVPKSVPIYIQPLKAVLVVDSVKTIPSTVAPGENIKVLMKLKNTADSYIKYVKTSLELYIRSVTTTTVTTTELPFTPLSGSSAKTLYQMGAGEVKEVVYDLIVDPDATPGPYKVPLTISYTDSLGTNYSNSELVGIMVAKEPDLRITVEKSEIYKESPTGEITLKFVNRDVGDIQFLNVKLLPSDWIKLFSSDEVYVGKIDSDDYQTAAYKLMVKDPKIDSVKLPLYLEYSDATNKPYTKKTEVVLNIYTQSETTTKQSSTWPYIIGAVVLVFAGYFVYRRFKKRNNNKIRK